MSSVDFGFSAERVYTRPDAHGSIVDMDPPPSDGSAIAARAFGVAQLYGHFARSSRAAGRGLSWSSAAPFGGALHAAQLVAAGAAQGSTPRLANGSRLRPNSLEMSGLSLARLLAGTRFEVPDPQCRTLSISPREPGVVEVIARAVELRASARAGVFAASTRVTLFEAPERADQLDSSQQGAAFTSPTRPSIEVARCS